MTKDHDVPGVRVATKVIHAGQCPDPCTCAVMPPISLASTYVQSSPGVHKGLEYSRSHNPTRFALERMVAQLEGSTVSKDQDSSLGGFAFASGLAAMSTCLELLDAGSRILAMDDLYGGSNRLLRVVRQRTMGLEVEFADMSELAAFERAMTPATKMVWVETPTNPMLKIADLSAIAKRARAVNPDVILVCDNTFATPVNQMPLEHGFDIVLHSTTKYLNGHSDSVGGVLIAKDAGFAERLRFLQNSIGAVASPFESYMILRGIKTLDVRMERHNESGLTIARFLEQHPGVERVIYPALASHPQHELYKRQMSGATGMISFEVAGGIDDARRFLESLQIFALAESLGGVESLVEHPGLMTHSSVPPEHRRELGITDSLIRLSVGIEDVNDLIGDLERGLGVLADTRIATVKA